MGLVDKTFNLMLTLWWVVLSIALVCIGLIVVAGTLRVLYMLLTGGTSG